MRRILLVEDESIHTLALMKLLAPEEYDVRMVFDGRCALAVAHEFHPEVVILDYKMPEMYGTDVAWEFAADDSLKAIPIIVCTAFPDPGLVSKFPPAPKGIPILEKPVNLERLREVLSAAFD